MSSTPGVYVVELPPIMPHEVIAATTSVAAVIGVFQSGGPGQATLVSSWQEFQQQFGNTVPGLLATYAVWQFFQNGGGQAWIVPIAPSDAQPVQATLGPLTIYGKGTSWQDTNLEVSLEAPSPPGGYTAPPNLLDFVVRDTSQLDSSGNPSVVERLSAVPHLATDGAPAALAGVITGQSSYVTAKVTSPGPAQNIQPVSPVALGSGVPGTWTATDLLNGIEAELGKLDATQPAWFSSPALDQIAPQVFNLLCIPDLVWLDASGYEQAQLAALDYCQSRQAFFIADAPAPAAAVAPSWITSPTTLPPTSGKLGIQPLVKALKNIGLNSYSAAVYYPWITIGDPQGGAALVVPPSGTVAGVYARTDAARGVWKAPAGTSASLMGAVGLVESLSDDVVGDLNSLGINCLRSFPVIGPVVWGARTMAGADLLQSGWKYVPIRRTADFVEQSLTQSLNWAVFEPNGEALWASLRLEAGQFMAQLNAQGAFYSDTGSPGYTVACDATTTTEADRLAGIVNLVVGFQGMNPAEFVVLKIQLYAGSPSAAS